MLSSITISQITNRLLYKYIKEGDDFNHSGSPLVNYNHQLRHVLFSILLVAATKSTYPNILRLRLCLCGGSGHGDGKDGGEDGEGELHGDGDGVR